MANDNSKLFRSNMKVFKGTWGETSIETIWFSKDTIDIDNLDHPFTQVYGFCFTDDFQVLLISEKENEWKVPGGTPEGNETAEQALKRELIEEADVLVERPIFLGARLVDHLGGFRPNTQLSRHYQLRYICKIKELLPQTPDPDNGKVYPRKLVPLEALTREMNWGEEWEIVCSEAIELARKTYFEA